MIKYIVELITRLTDLKSGITVNLAAWAGQAETPATVQAKIDQLQAKDDEIEGLKETVSVKLAEARTLKNQLEVSADSIEHIAIGIHSQNPEKLVEYNIKLRKPPEPANPPTMIPTVVLDDDTDGDGFKLGVQHPITDATDYEWEKGIAANPADVNTVPPLSHLITTKKLSIVDDQVAKGVRYFYRVRAINRKGNGPWSAPLSRVQ